MILYSISHGAKRLDWAGTQADAKQALKDQQELHPGAVLNWCETIVPVDKPNLLTWLKENVLGEKKVKRSAETPHLLPQQAHRELARRMATAMMETNPQIVRQGPHKMWNVLDQE